MLTHRSLFGGSLFAASWVITCGELIDLDACSKLVCRWKETAEGVWTIVLLEMDTE